MTYDPLAEAPKYGNRNPFHQYLPPTPVKKKKTKSRITKKERERKRKRKEKKKKKKRRESLPFHYRKKEMVKEKEIEMEPGFETLLPDPPDVYDPNVLQRERMRQRQLEALRRARKRGRSRRHIQLPFLDSDLIREINGFPNIQLDIHKKSFLRTKLGKELRRRQAIIDQDKNSLLQLQLEDRNQVDSGMRDELTNIVNENLTSVLGPLNTTLRQPNVLYPKDFIRIL
jgi:hypothetical protein